MDKKLGRIEVKDAAQEKVIGRAYLITTVMAALWVTPLAAFPVTRTE